MSLKQQLLEMTAENIRLQERVRYFKVLWRDYTSALNDPTYYADADQRGVLQAKVEQAFDRLTQLAKEVP